MEFRVYKFVEDERYEVAMVKVPEERHEQLNVFVQGFAIIDFTNGGSVF